jgi:hypothetical protein
MGAIMSADRGVRIALSGVQVEQVVRQISGHAGVTRLLPEVPDLDELQHALQPLLTDTQYSRSACRALLVLAAFPADGSEVELTEVARALEISPSTTHRYIATWMAIGLLEQDPRSRRYRRPLASSEGSERETSATGGSDAG